MAFGEQGAGFQNPPVGNQGIIERQLFRSENFVTGVSGWAIYQNGNAEFNSLTIRGTFLGSNFEINSLGAFFYSGVPALGNLIASITGAAGADDGFGNSFRAGINSYGVGGSYLNLLNNVIKIGSNATDTGGSILGGGGQINYASGVSGVGDTNASMVLISKFLTLGATNPQVLIAPTASPNSLTGEMCEVQGNLAVEGVVNAILPGALVEETWHSLGTLAGYAVTKGRYKINNEGDLKLDIQVTAGGANAAVATFSNTLPNAPDNYRPATVRRFTLETGRAVTAGDNWPTLIVNTSGTVQVSTVLAINATLEYNGAVPLD